MGFYGNISTSNKSSFTFDHIYPTRKQMDDAANTDGVFMGRYVLVEYDETPISAYYNFDDSWFYNDPHFNRNTRIESPKDGALYQNIGKTTNGESDLVLRFFRYSSSEKRFVPITIDIKGNIDSPYAANYYEDVKIYGRGYDSTAWMKRWDSSKNIYRYVLVAELNSVVPLLHMIREKPPVDGALDAENVPYFDRDTTGVDYYLHMPSDWKWRIRATEENEKSDTDYIEREVDKYTYNNGVETHTTNIEHKKQDIFYNRAGFEHDINTYITDVQDSIGYTTAQSGRKYGAELSNNGLQGYPQDDIYEWHIRLPILGNAVSQMWDKVYGVNRTNNKRFIRESQELVDQNVLTTYNRETVIGMINTMRDILGYTFKEIIDNNPAVGSKKTIKDDNIYYTVEEKDNDIAIPNAYYYYAYDPQFTKDVEGSYYLDNGEYRLANKLALPTDTQYYTLVSNYTLSPLGELESNKNNQFTTGEENGTIYGLIVSLHRLIGTGDPDTRDDGTLKGCINHIKDIIDNIDRQLMPNRLISTDPNTGRMITSNVSWPMDEAKTSAQLAGSKSSNKKAENINKVLTARNVSDNPEECWTLPVNMYLETLALKDAQGKYFDKWYGNSCYYGLNQDDTMGEAMKKMQEEMSDLRYVYPAINSFSVVCPTSKNFVSKVGSVDKEQNNLVFVERGSGTNTFTIRWSFNKGVRQSYSLYNTASNGATTNVLINQNTEKIDPEYYLNDSMTFPNKLKYNNADDSSININFKGSQNGDCVYTLNEQIDNVGVVFKLDMMDERSNTTTKSITISMQDRIYYGVLNGKIEATNILYNTLQYNELTNTKIRQIYLNSGEGQYFYYACPANLIFKNPKFKVGGFEGGFDLITPVDGINLANQYGVVLKYQIWRSTNPNLGGTIIDLL